MNISLEKNEVEYLLQSYTNLIAIYEESNLHHEKWVTDTFLWMPREICKKLRDALEKEENDKC